MLARKLFSPSSAQLPAPKTLASKSCVPITSKLIETKELQVLYFGNLRKTGGRGSYRLVHAAYSLRAEASPVLDLELAEMTVQMLIHQGGPFHRSERPEKEMWVLGANCRAAGYEAVDRFAQALALHGEIAFIGHEAAFLGRRVAAHGLALHQQRLLRNRPQQPSDKDPWRRDLSHRHLKRRRAMRQCLRWLPFAPLALATRLQPRQPCLHFFHPCRFKEMFHVETPPPSVYGMFSFFEHTCFERTSNSESNGGGANRQPGRKIILRGAAIQRVGETQEGHELSCPCEDGGNPRGRGEPALTKGGDQTLHRLAD